MVLYSPQVQAHALFLDIAFVIFVITGLTDIVDGYLARRFNVTSKFGRMMDPLADKVLVCGTFVCFAIIGEPRLYDLSDRALAVIHWSVAGILILRETYVTVLRQWAEAHGVNFAATKSGKIKMFLQAFAIGTVIIKMGHVQTALWGYCFTSTVFIVMVGATVVSGIRASMRDTSAPANDHSPTS
jgi:CDP-diacylglycerol--glycerol-3-phosphate 3-phosphatidyltransferase